MSSIPVHTSSPINPNAASKASGITSSTATPAESSPSSAVPTTTAASAASRAQPGAPAMPQPTGSFSPSHHTPIPTSTTALPASSTTSNPPPPQPGAVPSPYNTVPPPTYSTPAKPQPSITPQAHIPITPPPHSYPSAPAAVPLPAHQQSPALYNPNRAQPPASTTSTLQQHDLSHPPGYVQNAGASFEDKPLDAYQPHSNNTPRAGGGILDGGGAGMGGSDDDKGVWDTAVSWAKAAGQKLSEGEQQIWKSINGEK